MSDNETRAILDYLQKIGREVGEIKTVQGELLRRFDNVDQRFDGVYSRFDRVENRVMRLELDLKNAPREIEDHSTRLRALEDFKLRVAMWSSLGAAVGALLVQLAFLLADKI